MGVLAPVSLSTQAQGHGARFDGVSEHGGRRLRLTGVSEDSPEGKSQNLSAQGTRPVRTVTPIGGGLTGLLSVPTQGGAPYERGSPV